MLKTEKPLWKPGSPTTRIHFIMDSRAKFDITESSKGAFSAFCNLPHYKGLSQTFSQLLGASEGNIREHSAVASG